MRKEYFKNSDILLFLRRMQANPRRIGAITPSSRRLAACMAREALKTRQSPTDFILEIGPGTGRITRALLERGLEPNKLISVELDPALHNYMLQNFPHVNIIQSNATRLESLIPTEQHRKISAVVSGIPMRNLPALERAMIAQACFAVLKPGGKIIQFTYGLISSIAGPELKGEKVARIYVNLPPATVWSYRKPFR